MDQLKTICYHLQNAEGDAEGTSMAANVLGVFLESFIDVATEEEGDLFHLEGRHNLFSGIPGLKSAKEKVHALLSCMIHVRDLLLTISGEVDEVHKGELYLLGVFPCLEQVFSVSAKASASRYTVQSIARLLWLMFYKLSGRAVARDIGFGSFAIQKQITRNY